MLPFATKNRLKHFCAPFLRRPSSEWKLGIKYLIYNCGFNRVFKNCCYSFLIRRKRLLIKNENNAAPSLRYVQTRRLMQ